MKNKGRVFGSTAELARLDRELKDLRGLIENTRSESRTYYRAVVRAILQAVEKSPYRTAGLTALLRGHLDAVSGDGRIAVRGPFVYTSLESLLYSRRRRNHRRIEPAATRGRGTTGLVRRFPRAG